MGGKPTGENYLKKKKKSEANRIRFCFWPKKLFCSLYCNLTKEEAGLLPE